MGVHSPKPGAKNAHPGELNMVRVNSGSDSRTCQEFQGVNHAETNKLRVVHRGNRSVGCDLDSARERGRSKGLRSESAGQTGDGRGQRHTLAPPHGSGQKGYGLQAGVHEVYGSRIRKT